MKKELMWICSLLPQKLSNNISEMCKALNQDIGLPETVFKLPLHISLKKSFNTMRFDAVREDLVRLMYEYGSLECSLDKVLLHKNMIWISVRQSDKLTRLHNEIDNLLLTKYAIAQNKFDADFEPHISLFTSGNRQQIKTMYDRLKDKMPQSDVEMSRFVIGSSAHKDRFYDVSKNRGDMTYKNPRAVYACVNFGDTSCPDEIKIRSVCINGDIKEVFEKIGINK